MRRADVSASPAAADILPAPLGAAIERAVDRQMWCFGRDVHHPEGNLLVALGFTRVPSRVPGRPSEYRRRIGPCMVRLWGFAAVVVPPCGPALVVRRLDRGARVMCRAAASDPLITRDALGELATPATGADRAVVARWLPWALRLLARYERAVAGAAGAAWRTRTQRSWQRGQDEVVDTGAQWRLLARDVRAALTAPA